MKGFAVGLMLAPLAAAVGTAQSTQCASRPAASRSLVNRDSGKVRIVENWSAPNLMVPWRIDPTPVAILGESSDSRALLGRVESATRLSTGEIIVADEQAPELKVFLPSGSLSRTIGRRGSGPGEFQRVGHMARLAGDTIAVGDFRANRISYFDGAGKFVRSIEPPRVEWTDTVNGREQRGAVRVTFLGQTRSGDILGTRPRPGFSREKPSGFYARQMFLELVLVGPDGRTMSFGEQVQREYWELFKGGSIFFDDMPFTPESQYVVGGDAAFVTDGRAWDVRQYSKDGLAKLIRLCRSPLPITAARRAAFVKDAIAKADTGERAAHEEAFAKMRFPAVFPAITGLRADPEGRLWARAFAEGDSAERWEAFDAAGRHVGALLLPARTSLLEVGRDHILARHLDADSVQTVHMYKVIR
jgi:hypothetical protein